MSCGFKDENGDICGETSTCRSCKARTSILDKLAQTEYRSNGLLPSA